MVETMTARRLLVSLAAVAFATAACTGSNGENDLGLDANFSAQMASSWHWAGDPQRVEVGIFGSDADGIHVVSGGTIDLTFSYLGTDGGGEPTQGPSATATYVPVPGTEPAGDQPAIVTGARGVYETEDVVFDQPGVWQVAVTAEIDGVSRRLNATIPVTQESPIPAPGDRALKTENLTVDAKGVPDCAIDSLACGGGEIQDPELHEWTIADAIQQHRPALVLFGTPAFCESQMCGPEMQELQRLAAEYPDRAVYIHVEIWRDYDAQPQVVNRAAADWLLRKVNGAPEMTEPWLYLIGADGVIVDRWGSLFDPDEVASQLEALPPMSS
jgi:hypothetical protein